MSVPAYKRVGSQLACYDKAYMLSVSVLKDLRPCLSSYDTVIQDYAKNISKDIHLLLCHILHANAINAQYEWEVAERRKFQDYALGDCMSLQNDFLLIATLDPQTLNYLVHYATDVKEIEVMIRSWRKYNGTILARIQKKRMSSKFRNPGNFYNLNQQGNANNNNANNANGVRPD